MDIFTAIYFAALVIEMIIRAPLNRKRRQEKMSERRVTNQEIFILMLLLLGGFIMPIIYASTNWLDFANYTLPAMGKLAWGSDLGSRGLCLLARACGSGTQLVTLARNS